MSLPGGGFDPFEGNPSSNAGFYWQHWASSKTDSPDRGLKQFASHINQYVYELLSPLAQLHILRVKSMALEAKWAALNITNVASAAPPVVSTKQIQSINHNQLTKGHTFALAENGYITSSRRLLAPSSALLALRQRGLMVYRTDSLTANPSYRFYQDELNQLHELATQRRVKLLFFLPNRLTAEEAKVLIPIFRQLAPEQRLTIPYDTRIHQLFKPQFSMDEAHLNDDGARLYTTLIAETFQKHVASAD